VTQELPHAIVLASASEEVLTERSTAGQRRLGPRYKPEEGSFVIFLITRASCSSSRHAEEG
jgi:hypothetical protein